MTSESTPEFLTVSQAAAALGVSEKTLRKRIASGAVAAVREKLPGGGWAWRVDASRLEDSNRFQPRDGSATERLEADLEGARELSSVNLPTVPTGAMEGSNRVTEAQAITALLAEKDARIADLRGQIEAANRQAAEATAALREYLKLSAKALPAPGAAPGDESARNAQEAPQKGETGKEPSKAGNAAPGGKAREARPLWKVVLGIR